MEAVSRRKRTVVAAPLPTLAALLVLLTCLAFTLTPVCAWSSSAEMTRAQYMLVGRFMAGLRGLAPVSKRLKPFTRNLKP
jgi:hypothetical protein